MSKFLIIQTAFIGDVILATSVVEKIHQQYPDAQIDFLLRNGNASLLDGNPKINEVIVWDKSNRKDTNLFGIIRKVRNEGYDYVINLHRWFSSGLVTILSGARNKIGFNKIRFRFCLRVRLSI